LRMLFEGVQADAGRGRWETVTPHDGRFRSCVA
jgi:hypothetical protein